MSMLIITDGRLVRLDEKLKIRYTSRGVEQVGPPHTKKDSHFLFLSQTWQEVKNVTRTKARRQGEKKQELMLMPHLQKISR